MSTPTTTQEAPPPQPGDRVAVLLVDDQIIIAEAVRRILATQKGIEFIFCQDGQAALAQAATSNPTVILQDLVMPGVDGLDLVRGYRSQQVTAETPIIVLSSKEEGATKAAAFSAGALRRSSLMAVGASSPPVSITIKPTPFQSLSP